jgi:hypothetical protein
MPFIQHWLGLSEAFRTIFPPTGEDVISGFFAIFPDGNFPTFGTDFAFEEQDDGMFRVFATADQFEPDAVAALLHRTITQSLPVAVTWSYDSDRHQPDAFGGGGFMIDPPASTGSRPARSTTRSTSPPNWSSPRAIPKRACCSGTARKGSARSMLPISSPRARRSAPICPLRTTSRMARAAS